MIILSISHSEDKALAVLAYQRFPGVDVDIFAKGSEAFADHCFTENEIESFGKESSHLTFLLTLKESVSKVLQ